jgi:hypothetical protein
MLTLIEETAGRALELIDKNGGFLPFCQARSREGDAVIISPGDEGCEQGEVDRHVNSVWIELKRRISTGEVAEFAFCSDSFVKLQGEKTEQRRLKIEFQNGTEETGIYLFPLLIKDGKAELGGYVVADVRAKFL